MNINSVEFGNELMEIINKQVEKKVNKILKEKRIVTSWVATVDTYDAGNVEADVFLPNETTAITRPNRTGGALINGDEVYLISPTGNLSNSFILVKK